MLQSMTQQKKTSKREEIGLTDGKNKAWKREKKG
jgi:hypothetical protein